MGDTPTREISMVVVDTVVCGTEGVHRKPEEVRRLQAVLEERKALFPTSKGDLGQTRMVKYRGRLFTSLKAQKGPISLQFEPTHPG